MKANNSVSVTVTITVNCLQGSGVQTAVWSSQQNFDSGNPDLVTIQPANMACPSQAYPTLTGGGFRIDPNGTDANLGNVFVATYPSATKQIFNQQWNWGALGGNGQVSVICAQGIYPRPMATTVFPAKTTTQNQLDGNAQCPTQSVLVGGGYQVFDPRINVTAYFPITVNATGVPDFTTWHVGGNYSQGFDLSNSYQITLYALCVADTPIYG